MDAPKEVNPELESFREQWRAEVRATKPVASSSQPSSSSSTSRPGTSKTSAAPAPPRPTTHLGSGKPKAADAEEDEADEPEPVTFDESEPAKRLSEPANNENADLVTALDHYERAVERESQGSLGDSLMLYRKAFRVCLALPDVKTLIY